MATNTNTNTTPNTTTNASPKAKAKAKASPKANTQVKASPKAQALASNTIAHSARLSMLLVPGTRYNLQFNYGGKNYDLPFVVPAKFKNGQICTNPVSAKFGAISPNWLGQNGQAFCAQLCISKNGMVVVQPTPQGVAINAQLNATAVSM